MNRSGRLEIREEEILRNISRLSLAEAQSRDKTLHALARALASKVGEFYFLVQAAFK